MCAPKIALMIAAELASEPALQPPPTRSVR
jgi:hypothetical protein